MPLSQPLLTARWSDVVLLTFAAPEDLVRASIPAGVELDRWNGGAHVSVVALRMSAVRVAGWRVPGLTAFPQINLRTYVRHHDEPGVWFVREIVPSRLIAAVARLGFGEPFRALPIRSHVSAAPGGSRVRYEVGPVVEGWHLSVTGTGVGSVPSRDSAAHHFIDRALACRQHSGRGLTVVRVTHPPWAVREVTGADYRVDFHALYGADWSFLNDTEPVSIIWAVGSDVAVFAPERA